MTKSPQSPGPLSPLAIGDPFSVDYINQQHVLYRDANGQVSDIYYNGDQWTYQNLSIRSGATASIVGDLCSVVYGSQQHVIYQTKTQIFDIYYNGSQWVFQNLISLTKGAVPAQGTPFSVVYANQQHVVYWDINGNISDIYYNGNTWVYQNLTNLAGAPTPSKGSPNSVNYGHSGSGAQQHVLYRDINDNICDLYYNGKWNYQNLTERGNAPSPANGDPWSVTTNNYNSNAQQHVFYLDRNNHVCDLYYNGHWNYQDLTTRGNAPLPAANNPIAASNSATGMSAVQHVVYLDQDNNICDLYYNGSSWSYTNLTDTIGIAAAPQGNPFPVFYGSQIHIVYRDINDNISDIYYNGKWNYQTLLPFPTETKTSRE